MAATPSTPEQPPRRRGIILGAVLALLAMAALLAGVVLATGDGEEAAEPAVAVQDEILVVVLAAELGVADANLAADELRDIDGVASVSEATPGGAGDGEAAATLRVEILESADVDAVIDATIGVDGVETVEWRALDLGA